MAESQELHSPGEPSLHQGEGIPFPFAALLRLNVQAWKWAAAPTALHVQWRCPRTRAHATSVPPYLCISPFHLVQELHLHGRAHCRDPGQPPPVLVHPNLHHAPQSALRIPTCPEHPNLPLPLAQPPIPSPPPPWQSSALLSSLRAEHLIDRIIPYLLISSLVLSGQEWGRLCFPFIPKLSVFAGCRGSVSNLL